jgi:hypothetical protein
MRNITSEQYQRAAELQREIEERQSELDGIFGEDNGNGGGNQGMVSSARQVVSQPPRSSGGGRSPKARIMSPAARKAISEAAKRRWAKWRKEGRA